MTATKLFGWMDRVVDFLGGLLFAIIFGVAVVVCRICDEIHAMWDFLQAVNNPFLTIGLFLVAVLFLCITAFIIIPCL